MRDRYVTGQHNDTRRYVTRTTIRNSNNNNQKGQSLSLSHTHLFPLVPPSEIVPLTNALLANFTFSLWTLRLSQATANRLRVTIAITLEHLQPTNEQQQHQEEVHVHRCCNPLQSLTNTTTHQQQHNHTQINKNHMQNIDNGVVVAGSEPTAGISTAAGLQTLNDRLEHLSVSPPRPTQQQESQNHDGPASTSPVWRNDTPRASTIIVRTHSSPGLMDTSPKDSPRHCSPYKTVSSSTRQQQSSCGAMTNKTTTTSSPRAALALKAPTSPGNYFRAPHELTPVMNNTSIEYADADEDGGYVVVSPDDTELHGESLTLPSEDTFVNPRTLRKRSSLSLPPLPVRKSDNTSSTAHSTTAQGNDADRQQPPQPQLKHPPIELSKKYYSFNSRHQYSQAVAGGTSGVGGTIPPSSGIMQEHSSLLLPQQQRHESNENYPPPIGLKPYQPSRHEMGDVGPLPHEELSRIFIPRCNNNNAMSSSESSSSLMQPVPLEERQWSIPSIRLATHVNGSITSYTDEEDEIQEDDASWSSRGSSLCIPEEQPLVMKVGTPPNALTATANGLTLLPAVVDQDHHVVHDTEDDNDLEDNDGDDEAMQILSQSQQSSCSQPVVIEGDFHHHHHHHHVNNSNDRNTATSVTSDSAAAVVTPRKRRGEQERQAYEWLRTVESSGENEIAEAASSKFLTGSQRTLNRQKSSPSHIEIDANRTNVARNGVVRGKEEEQ